MTGPFHQHDRVEHAEDRDVGPDAEREREDHDQERGCTQAAQRIKKIARECIETHGYRSLQQVEELCGGARWIVVEVGDNLLAESRPEIGGIR